MFKKFAIILALTVTGAVLLLTTWISGSDNNLTSSLSVAGIIVFGAGIVIWIRRGIRVFYRKKFDKRSDDMLQQEIDRLTHENQQLLEVNETVRAENHSINHRFATLERNYGRAIELTRSYVPAEVSEELSVDIEKVRKLSREYQDKISQVKAEAILPSTGVQEIDDLFALFAERFADSGIDFALKVKGSIINMTESVIKQDKLETMIGDHLQDALVAVEVSGGSFRSVRATIGKIGEFYEFTVHDSGIPFEIDTLIRLGTERVTTHAADGGSGIGFMKTFETMRESGASLIIRENKGGIFSKSVTIRFNGLNQFIIETYRPDDFPPSDRYTVAGHN